MRISMAKASRCFCRREGVSRNLIR